MRALLAIALLIAAAPAAARQPVRYDVAFPNAVHHEAEITITFTDLPASPLQVRMSRSSPGRYALHEFAKNVYAVRATDSRGNPLAVTRPDPYGWTVSGHDGTVRFSYTLFADRADGTYSGIDNTHAHLNIPATFAWARGLEDRPITVSFRVPRGSNWKVATQLFATDDPYTFTAPNLYYFLDSPVELSDFDVREWTVHDNGRDYTIRLAVHHDGTQEELDAYTEMAKAVVAEQIAVFGEVPDFETGSYVFIACYLPWVSGDGMEHRNSTILTSTRPIGAGAARNLGTLSHEFFHAWNTERLRARSLEPFDFERANMSDALWFGEGFTSYYDDLTIHRAGLMDLDAYASGLAGMLNAVINSPGRRFFSPVEMSMQAPFVDAATSVDPHNRVNTFISYYTWGSAIGLGLDLTLRTRFNKTLDQFMRALWAEFGRTEVPYTVDDLRLALGRFTSDQGFADDFFARYITGREIVDYESLLARAGLLLRKVNPGAPTLGRVALQPADGGVVVASQTLIGSPLYEAGLDRGDLIVSLGGSTVATPADVQAIVAAHRPGDTLEVAFVQRGQSRTARVTLAEDDRLEVVPFENAGRELPRDARRFREAWLGSQVPAKASTR